MVWKRKVTVDLVGDHIDVMLLAYFPDPPQFIHRPNPANRVVRTAEKKQLHPVPNDLLLKILKIDLIASVPINQLIFHDLPPIVPNDGKKG